MSLPVIIIGGGGHARVVADLARALRLNVLGYVAPAPSNEKLTEKILGPYLGTDDSLLKRDPAACYLLNGIGTDSTTQLRHKLFHQFKEKGFSFGTLIHPNAIIGREVEVGEGSQVMAGAVIQIACTIGPNTIINSRASVDHDCTIGESCHIAPGSVLCGKVNIGANTLIGAHSTVVPSVSIAAHTTIGAHSLVLRSIQKENGTFIGAPAVLMEKNDSK